MIYLSAWGGLASIAACLWTMTHPQLQGSATTWYFQRATFRWKLRYHFSKSANNGTISAWVADDSEKSGSRVEIVITPAERAVSKSSENWFQPRPLLITIHKRVM